jgi:hypothetical protein
VHGGESPIGAASRHFKTGFHSDTLKRLGLHGYDARVKDPDLVRGAISKAAPATASLDACNFSEVA